jgi:hypothetical protein
LENDHDNHRIHTFLFDALRDRDVQHHVPRLLLLMQGREREFRLNPETRTPGARDEGRVFLALQAEFGLTSPHPAHG